MQDIKQFAEKILDSIPFSKFLGLKVENLNVDNAEISLQTRPEFIGNHVQGILHGGVISSVIDSLGGLIVMINAYQRVLDRTYEEQVAQLGKVGTIDLRVDYLRPGRGEQFRADGHVLRSGNKVTVTRMNMYNDEKELIAVGTGTYLIG